MEWRSLVRNRADKKSDIDRRKVRDVMWGSRSFGSSFEKKRNFEKYLIKVI